MRSATIAETDGVCFGLLIVATMTTSIWSGVRPDFAIASAAASVDSSMTVVSSTARVRVMIPVRWRIHSSLESIASMRSELGTAISPRAAP